MSPEGDKIYALNSINEEVTEFRVVVFSLFLSYCYRLSLFWVLLSQQSGSLQLLPLFLQFVPASHLKDCSKNKAHLLYLYFHSATNYNDKSKFHF